MGTLTVTAGEFEYQWASDVNFDGLRLEVLNSAGNMLFDVSVPGSGELIVNTFSNEVSANLLLAAIEVARERQ